MTANLRRKPKVSVIVATGALFAWACTAAEVKKPQAEPKSEVYPAVEPASAPAPKAAPANAGAPKAVQPAPVKPAAELPALLKEVESKYASAATLEADFTQVNEISSMSRKKTSSGVLWLKRPDKFRWQTNEPDPNLLVSDGRRFWYYTPPFEEGEAGQVVVRKSAEMQTDLARALLAGSFSAARDVTISSKGENRFLVVPAPGTAGTVKEAEVEIDLKRKVIEKVILVHEGGNRSEIRLARIALGKKLEDTMFRFSPPPGTEVLKE